MNHEHTLRKAAILIDTLETDRADALLEQMPPDQQALIRNLIVELKDVDDAEREEVVAAFRAAENRETPAHPSQEPDDVVTDEPPDSPKAPVPGEDVWLEIGADRVGHPQAGPSSEPSGVTNDEMAAEQPSGGPRFAFLEETPPKELAKCFQHENTQAVAIVMSHLTPRLAAQVVACFTPPIQTDVLQRLSELTAAQPAILDDLEMHIRSKLISQSVAEKHATEEESVGRRALQRILDEADDDQRRQLLDRLEGNLPEAAECEDAGITLAEGFHDAADEMPVDDVPAVRGDEPIAGEPISDVPIADGLHRSRFSWERSAAGRQVPSAMHPQWTFDDLESLDDPTFIAILERVDPAVVLIALTSARDTLLDKLLRQLPRRQARDLRCRLEQLGPLRLTDIDEAQRQIVFAATQELDRFRPAA